jgi:hypothetical protein
MTPALEQHHQPNLRKLKRSAYVPSLPLEVWILIFFQNTDPSHLYTIGRQVCSAWRTEIPKVIAKKYLEDPTMVQIHSHCETSRLKRFACLLGPELGFSHYQGTANDRAVFKPIYKALEAPDHHEPECNTMYGRARRRGSQSVDDLRLPIAHDHGNRIQHVGGKHVDLPPCQIRIKWVSNDTELPGLEVDFAKGEVSFQWQPMLELFYREAAALDRHDSRLAAEAMEWLDAEDRSIADVLVRTWKDRAARESRRMMLRCKRIKDWYCNVHNHKHSGRFDTCYEDMALRGFQGLEWPEKRIRPCAEDSDEKERMKLRYQAYSALGLVDWIVYDRKVPTWNRNEIASYWETLATRILFAETPVDEHRSMDEITRTELFRRLEDTTTQPLLNMEFDHEDDLHPCGQSAYWTSVQTPREDSDDYQTENDSTKAKLHERREKEKVYAAIWLGRSRV